MPNEACNAFFSLYRVTWIFISIINHVKSLLRLDVLLCTEYENADFPGYAVRFKAAGTLPKTLSTDLGTGFCLSKR